MHASQWGATASPLATLLAALQWLLFHVGVVLSVPIILGAGFQLQPSGVENLMRLTFFITGAGTLLQSLLGHRNMLVEGPAGPWWASFLVIAGVAVSAGTPIETVRTDIQGGLMIGGLVLVLAGVTGIVDRLKALFTSRVTGVFLMLIGVQVSGIGVEGMVSQGLELFLISTGVLLLSVLLLSFGRGLLRQAALLISVIAGWLAAAATGHVHIGSSGSSALLIPPDPLPWGMPTFDLGTALTLSLLGILLIPNQIGSLKAMEQAKGEQIPTKYYGNGLAATGGTCFFAGLFGGSGTTPFAISAGLVSITGEKRKTAFTIGAVIFVLVGLVGPLAALLSTIPQAVAGAVLLTSVGSIAVIGMRSIAPGSLGGTESLLVGMGLLAGTGVMFVPPEIWSDVPAWAASIFSNGVITGTLITLLFEHAVLSRRR